ncbi:hypothetical protein JX265_012619 [Neoarthrinium moseri]|uniref:Uncharacterized protein n=1 Tax=Neoarthrinium moseri TaxID=1658444 RepID=A0A9Q0AJF9_9PEZI|nr:hypothetical protein JX265_012619 [Neoarthrinium moseri]
MNSIQAKFDRSDEACAACSISHEDVKSPVGRPLVDFKFNRGIFDNADYFTHDCKPDSKKDQNHEKQNAQYSEVHRGVPALVVPSPMHTNSRPQRVPLGQLDASSSNARVSLAQLPQAHVLPKAQPASGIQGTTHVSTPLPRCANYHDDGTTDCHLSMMPRAPDHAVNRFISRSHASGYDNTKKRTQAICIDVPTKTSYTQAAWDRRDDDRTPCLTITDHEHMTVLCNDSSTNFQSTRQNNSDGTLQSLDDSSADHQNVSGSVTAAWDYMRKDDASPHGRYPEPRIAYTPFHPRHASAISNEPLDRPARVIGVNQSGNLDMRSAEAYCETREGCGGNHQPTATYSQSSDMTMGFPETAMSMYSPTSYRNTVCPARVGPSSDSTAGQMLAQQLWVPLGMSVNYKGNIGLRANQSADIPDYLSCSLWITNLNLSAANGEHDLLSQIKGCGKVYACVINPPDTVLGHTTSAAKLVFFRTEGAGELIRRSQMGDFVVNGYVPKVVYNRIRTAPQQPGPESRVIHIDGPKAIVDVDFLTLWFSQRFVFQTDEVLALSEEAGPNGRRRLEWRFGSYRCQASAAMSFIDKERRRGYWNIGQHHNLWRQVHTYFAVDPCA